MGDRISDEKLADEMLRLQRIGCHNINLVTPTHVMPHILRATRIAFQKGLRLPLVYNTSGYERVEMVPGSEEGGNPLKGIFGRGNRR